VLIALGYLYRCLYYIYIGVFTHVLKALGYLQLQYAETVDFRFWCTRFLKKTLN
jgi:hypothetical protein